MAKKIVVCFDGTWNVPKQSGGELEHHETNVVKMFRSILGEDMSPGQLGTSAQSPRGARTVKWYARALGPMRAGGTRTLRVGRSDTASQGISARATSSWSTTTRSATRSISLGSVGVRTRPGASPA